MDEKVIENVQTRTKNATPLSSNQIDVAATFSFKSNHTVLHLILVNYVGLRG